MIKAIITILTKQMDFMTTIKQQLITLFKKAIHAEYQIDMDPIIQLASRPDFGDYQANFPLRLAKELQKKPIEIATAVIARLQSETLFQKLEPSGPGFINIILNNVALAKQLQTLVNDERLGVAKTTSPQTIVVDYGGANVAKEMHVGHLRSAVIGDAIVRLLEFLGNKVIRQNHLGDWGTQFGMLIEHLLETQQQYNVYDDLTRLYKAAKQRFDDEADFREKARLRVVALQQGDTKSRAVWQQLVDQSKKEFQTVYTKLGVLLTNEDVCSESFYNDMLAPLVNDLLAKDIAMMNAGAAVIFLHGFMDPEGNPLPLLIRKSDGGYLYATTDLAAIRYRTQTLKANKIIYVVDVRQKQHFEMVFAAAEKAGWTNHDVKLQHVVYGAVLGEDRKPFKTRSGDSVKLNDLLLEAEKRAAEMVVQKHPDLDGKELSAIANTIGIGALKYADLRGDRIKDYVFSWDKMLAFDGNTGPYLQNAYVRICALFRKGNIDVKQVSHQDIQLTTAIEHSLAIKLLALPDVVYAIADHLQLHSLGDYLYDVASTFHRFYEACPVLAETDHEIRDSRLVLCELTRRTLQCGLNLLGINVLERM